MKSSKVYSSFDGKDVRPLVLNDVASVAANLDQLRSLGIVMDSKVIGDMTEGLGYAMDTIQGTLTTQSISTQLQFLQTILPGVVRIATTPNKIDEIIGVMTAGDWYGETVIQSVLENTGAASVYTDSARVPFANWNQNWASRGIVRFESGISVGLLETERAAQIRVDNASEKRTGAMIALDKQRNEVGFYGYNGGNNATYGMLNDPNSAAYVTVATGAASSTLWANKTFDEIVKDLVTALSALRINSKDRIDPGKTPITLAVATAAREHMSRPNAIGSMTVYDWLAKNYPNVRVTSDFHFNAANSGENVFYLFADSVEDGSSDGGRTYAQIVPAKFMVAGVEKRIKDYIESYINATAGVMLKRPYAMVRYSGI